MRWEAAINRLVTCALCSAVLGAGRAPADQISNPLREAPAPRAETSAEPQTGTLQAAPQAPPAGAGNANAAAAPEEVELTPAAVQARRQQIEEANGLDEMVRTEALRLYDQALQELALDASFDAKVVQFEAKIQAVAADMQSNDEALKSLPQDPEVGFLDDKTVVELDQLVRRKEEERDAARKSVEELEAEHARRADRRQELLKLIEAAKARLKDIEQKLAAPAPPEQPAELQTARRTLLLTQRQAAHAEVIAAEKEIASYEARVEVLPLRRRLAERRFALAEKAAEKVRRVFEHKRMLDVQLQLTEAQSQLGAVAEEIRTLAEQNIELAQKRVELDESLRQADASTAPGSRSRRSDSRAPWACCCASKKRRWRTSLTCPACGATPPGGRSEFGKPTTRCSILKTSVRNWAASSAKSA
jgi:hypothetical protein